VKRFALSILAVLYLAVGSGIVVNKHFCMNRLDSWEFYGKLDDKCNRCGMESTEKHGCCHDEVHVIKLTPDQKLALLSFDLSVPQEIQLPAWINYFLAPLENGAPSVYYLNHSPPLLTDSDTYLQNNVFRI